MIKSISLNYFPRICVPINGQCQDGEQFEARLVMRTRI